MKRTKNIITSVIAIVMGMVGLGMILYPFIADWWNTMHMTEVIGAYDQVVSELDTSERDQMLADARRFNEKLAAFNHRLVLDSDEREEYYRLLDPADTGLMGYIDIPKMDVTLPIYHGTGDEVLTEGAGHLEGTSLPVGGVGTHSSITAHRGLPSARLFSDLNTLKVGDRFYITVLNITLTYEVDQIKVVLPNEIDDVEIDPQEDLCTLVTCTPYGVNSHRLLVRGRRVDDNGANMAVLADALRIEPRYVAPFLAVPIVLMLLLWLAFSASYRKQRRKEAARTAEDFERRREARRERAGMADDEQDGVIDKDADESDSGEGAHDSESTDGADTPDEGE